jgi:hypothetical protein
MILILVAGFAAAYLAINTTSYKLAELIPSTFNLQGLLSKTASSYGAYFLVPLSTFEDLTLSCGVSRCPLICIEIWVETEKGPCRALTLVLCL